MLSEHLQHRIRSDETSQTRVPHGSQVLAGVLLEMQGERSVVDPMGFAIRSQASSEGTGIGW